MFLTTAPDSAGADRLYDDDRREQGFVMNGSRLWAHSPALHDELFALLRGAAEEAGLGTRERGVLVTACASTLGDAYCSLAWGTRLGQVAGDELAAAVLSGTDSGLDAREQALARWARLVAADPNGTDAEDVQALRDNGFDERQILAITAYTALRLAFSTVNDALGVRPEPELVTGAPEAVREVVTWGRVPEGT
ncbi:carboxymuconolactone decarboxylase family protein [Blastococcus sp. LR1]|uniref:carboxymuconolactone decarboxylase family protein n=1 Tax=Blastococcus sp. LR1 TaxID=2877000 RepID=UPI001CCB9551|nr:hypothetical protein [Blastococcus sp. LR1]MCA0147043.1 hypothetical protein [Blastococcus sp. LR1]